MHSLPFNQPGRFWRGNLHTHSTISDGGLTPEQVCALYREAGYDFIALTDHFMPGFDWQLADTRPFRTSDFTTLIGAELHAPTTEFGILWHILAVGLPLDFAPNPENETGVTLAARALAAGAFVTIAHPDWYHLSEPDANTLDGVHAVEVFNGTSIDHNDKPGGWSLLDILLARRRRLNALATDDAHIKPPRADTLLGWTMVKSEANTPEMLLESLKAGHYYSSTGPAIYDVQLLPGNALSVRCSPAERIFVTGTGWQAASVYGNGLSAAEISLAKFDSPYVRVTVRDAKGGRAWSNPIWLDGAP
ncbi:MAG: PHP domain-containing protein [Armatimonadetes bacterium]|nr:PHP domain-containing protein [Anaerolineae bacterium]